VLLIPFVFSLSLTLALLCIKHLIKGMIKKPPRLQVAALFVKSNGGRKNECRSINQPVGE